MKTMFGIKIEYEWQPFTIDGRHFCFSHKSSTRLEQKRCSHRGAAIYKWEGKITEGPHPHLGKIGILIDETNDLHSRINQYATGTQAKGNKYWRTEFLECSKAALYVLECSRFELADGKVVPVSEMLNFRNGRLVLEQLLVLKERHTLSVNKWIVNKWDRANKAL